MGSENYCHKGTLDSMRLITLKDVMNITGMGRTYLYQLEKSGQLMPVRIGRNLRYVDSDVKSWIDLKIQNSRKTFGDK